MSQVFRCLRCGFKGVARFPEGTTPSKAIAEMLKIHAQSKPRCIPQLAIEVDEADVEPINSPNRSPVPYAEDRRFK